MKKILGRLFLALALTLVMSGLWVMPLAASTTADVVVKATPGYVAISCNVTAAGYNFGTVLCSTSYNTSTVYFGIDNTSTIQTDQTISVTSANWTGGDEWGNDNTGVAGVNIAVLNSQRGGTWGASVILVRSAGALNIYENCPAITDYDFGLSLKAPTVVTDAAEKSITLRVTAAAG